MSVPSRSGDSRLTIVVLALAVFAYSALEVMLALALPLIQQATGASLPAIAWAFTGMLLSGAVATPLVGRLADVRDKRHILLVLLVALATGTLTSAVATSLPMLIAGQLVQGMGLGLIPLSVAIVRDTQPSERMKSYNGILLAVPPLAFAVALVGSGYIVTKLSYTWIFWPPLALLVLALAAAWLIVPSCPAREAGRVDWLGAALLAVALSSLLIGVTLSTEWGWLSTQFLMLAAVSVIFFCLFTAVELRTDAPLVNLRLLAGRSVVHASVVSFIVGFGGFSIFVLVPLIVAAPTSTGYGLGASGTLAGVCLLPMGIFGTLSAPLAGRLERLIGGRAVLAVGAAAVPVSNLVMLLAPGNAAAIMVAAAISGMASGLGLTQAMNLVVALVPAQHTTSVGGLTFVIRSVGGTLGGQLAASIVASSPLPGAPQLSSWHGYVLAFSVFAALCALAVVLILALPIKDKAAKPEVAGVAAE